MAIAQETHVIFAGSTLLLMAISPFHPQVGGLMVLVTRTIFMQDIGRDVCVFFSKNPWKNHVDSFDFTWIFEVFQHEKLDQSTILRSPTRITPPNIAPARGSRSRHILSRAHLGKALRQLKPEWVSKNVNFHTEIIICSYSKYGNTGNVLVSNNFPTKSHHFWLPQQTSIFLE